tara:strand:- start:1441 stop:1644 length:204 start_codon:yes stop_codon:yes gene_type:complete
MFINIIIHGIGQKDEDIVGDTVHMDVLNIKRVLMVIYVIIVKEIIQGVVVMILNVKAVPKKYNIYNI